MRDVLGTRNDRTENQVSILELLSVSTGASHEREVSELLQIAYELAGTKPSPSAEALAEKLKRARKSRRARMRIL